MTEEIKRIIHYDERRKILSVKTEENKPVEFDGINGGDLNFTSSAEYNEEGIKMILNNSRKDKDEADKFIPICKDRIKEIEEEMKKTEIIEMTPDLIELEEKLKKIKSMKDREPKQKELDNLKEMLKSAEEKLRQSNKNIQEIKTEIGGRLKL